MKKRKSEEKLDKLLADFTDDLIESTGSSKCSGFEDADSPSSGKEEILSLFETVRTISFAVQPKEPSEEFVDRVSKAAQERLREQISAEKLQRIIGMAVTGEDFRKSLFQDVVAACRSIGLVLTPKEVAALSNLKEDAVEEFANSLDERITKFFPANLS